MKVHTLLIETLSQQFMTVHESFDGAMTRLGNYVKVNWHKYDLPDYDSSDNPVQEYFEEADRQTAGLENYLCMEHNVRP